MLQHVIAILLGPTSFVSVDENRYWSWKLAVKLQAHIVYCMVLSTGDSESLFAGGPKAQESAALEHGGWLSDTKPAALRGADPVGLMS